MATFSRYLDTNGDGTGTKVVTANYSGSATDFYLKPGAGDIFQIHRAIIYGRDTAVNADDYGAISGGLTTGITFTLENDDGQVRDLMDGVPVKTSAEWSRLCYDAQALSWGAGNEFFVVRWTFTTAGEPLTLRGVNRNAPAAVEGDKFVFTAEDDFSGLLDHTVLLQGTIL